MSLKLNANYFSWLTFDYNINYSISKRNNVNINALTSDLKILIYLSDKQHFGIFKEDYSYEYGNQKFKNQFLDLSYQYTFKKSKIDLELKWTNILNTKNYNELLLNDFSTISNTFLIRPSQILASLRFNFK